MMLNFFPVLDCGSFAKEKCPRRGTVTAGNRPRVEGLGQWGTFRICVTGKNLISGDSLHADSEV